MCAIVLREERYLREWVDYHLKLGFSRVYLYDNSNDFVLADFFEEWPQVQVLHWPGKRMQMPAYNHMLNTHRMRHRWCAFLDADEFVVFRPSYCANILELLHRHCPSGGLCLNWHMFGSSGQKCYEDRPVLQRFSFRKATLDPHVKSIVVMAHVVHFVHPHAPVMRPGFVCVDPHGHAVNGPFNSQGTDDIACVHHYFTKSREEFLDKVARGRADTGMLRSLAEFELNDHNDKEDTSASELYDTISASELRTSG